MKTKNVIKVTYVSVWDGGTLICTPAKFNRKKKLVYDIESQVVDVCTLDKEYLEVDGTDEVILDFITDSGCTITDGISDFGEDFIEYG